MFKFYQSLPPIPTGHAATCCDSQREAALPSPGLKASAPPFWPQLTAADRSQWLCATPCHSVPLCAALTVLFSRARRISCGLSMTFDDFWWQEKPEKTWDLGTSWDAFQVATNTLLEGSAAPVIAVIAVIAPSSVRCLCQESRPQALRLVRKCPAERSRRAENRDLTKPWKLESEKLDPERLDDP